MLWIRSQDKKRLIKANDIFIYNERIYAVTPEVNERTIGNYPTEAEAIRVLDMIEQHSDFYSANELKPLVFKMPEAGFSKKFIPDCGSDFCGLINPEIKDDDETPCHHMAECQSAWDRGCR